MAAVAGSFLTMGGNFSDIGGFRDEPIADQQATRKSSPRRGPPLAAFRLSIACDCRRVLQAVNSSQERNACVRLCFSHCW